MSPGLKTLIIEDEAIIAERLTRLFKSCCQQRDMDFQADIASSLAEAEHFLSQHPYDFLSLDLNLNGENGFKLLQLASSLASHTIVISAHRDQALNAFEYGVLDFIAKPFSQSRIDKALGRLLSNQMDKPHQTRYLVSKSGANLRRVDIKDIEFIEGYGNYSKIHLHCDESCLHEKGLEALNTLLPASFMRIHKSYILNLDSLVTLKSLGGGLYEVSTQSGTTVPVGRTKISALKAAIVLSIKS